MQKRSLKISVEDKAKGAKKFPLSGKGVRVIPDWDKASYEKAKLAFKNDPELMQYLIANYAGGSLDHANFLLDEALEGHYANSLDVVLQLAPPHVRLYVLSEKGKEIEKADKEVSSWENSKQGSEYLRIYGHDGFYGFSVLNSDKE